ncbi:MAG: hypothetical protein ACRD4B_01375, partial [Acidobacteriota bacterium]
QEELLGHLFEDTASELQQLDNELVAIASPEVPELIKSAANIILHEVRSIIIASHDAAEHLRITAANLAELVVLVHQDKVNSNAVRKVLDEMQKTGGDPDHIVQNLGLTQVSEGSDLEKYIEEVIAEHSAVVEKIKDGKEAALQFLMGQVMAKSDGKANPKVVVELLRRKILGT